MRTLTIGENMTVFLLFFGISLMDAVASGNWWRSAFWLAIAVMFAAFAWLGQRRKHERSAGREPGPS